MFLYLLNTLLVDRGYVGQMILSTNVHIIKQLFLVTKAFSTKYQFIFQFFASLHLNPKQKDTWKLEYLDLHIPELLPLFTKQTNKKIIER